MARPKTSKSEAERRAAKLKAQRARRMKPKTEVEAKNPDSEFQASMHEAQNEAVVEAENPVEAETEQWRLDAKRYMATGKLPKAPAPSPGFVAFRDCPEVPHSPTAAPWLGAGRGVVRDWKGKQYVLVARHRGNVDLDALEHGVVTADDHAARLNQRCQHKRAGWACHAC